MKNIAPQTMEKASGNPSFDGPAVQAVIKSTSGSISPVSDSELGFTRQGQQFTIFLSVRFNPICCSLGRQLFIGPRLMQKLSIT